MAENSNLQQKQHKLPPGIYKLKPPVGNKRWVEDATFGSTLAPLRHRRSNLTDLASRCQIERAYNWWGMDIDQTLALIGHLRDRTADPPNGLNLGTWSMRGDGNVIALDIRSSERDQLLGFDIKRLWCQCGLRNCGKRLHDIWCATAQAV